MNHDEARRVGAQFVESVLSRVRQDRGNARFVGSLAIGGVISKARSSINERLASRRMSTSAMPAAGRAVSMNVGEPPWFAILSADELVEFLMTCSVEEARTIVDYEESHLERSSVIDAGRRRFPG